MVEEEGVEEGHRGRKGQPTTENCPRPQNPPKSPQSAYTEAEQANPQLKIGQDLKEPLSHLISPIGGEGCEQWERHLYVHNF